MEVIEDEVMENGIRNKIRRRTLITPDIIKRVKKYTAKEYTLKQIADKIEISKSCARILVNKIMNNQIDAEISLPKKEGHQKTVEI